MKPWMGPLLVFLACGWFGFALAGKLNRRAAALRRAEALFAMLRGQVVRLSAPLPQALAQAGGELAKAADLLLTGDPNMDVAAAFRLAWADSGLAQGDIESLCLHAQMMERMQREDAESVLDGAVEAIHLLKEQAEATARKDGGLYRALGLCAGAALAVLML